MSASRIRFTLLAVVAALALIVSIPMVLGARDGAGDTQDGKVFGMPEATIVEDDNYQGPPVAGDTVTFLPNVAPLRTCQLTADGYPFQDSPSACALCRPRITAWRDTPRRSANPIALFRCWMGALASRAMPTTQSRLALPPIVATPLMMASRSRMDVTRPYRPRRYSASRDVAYDPASPEIAATRASSARFELSAAVRR